MSDNCWLCSENLNWAEGENEKHCPNLMCQVLNDRNPYPQTETQPKEEVMIVENSTNMTPFFKKGMVDVGSVGTIKGEFAPSGQYQNYTGEVDFDGQIIKVSLNKTSLYDIVGAYGNDTSRWVGKQIKYSIEDVENKKTNALYRGINIFRAVK